MKRTCRLRWVVLGLALVILIPAAHAEPFSVTAGYVDQSDKKNTTEGIFSGEATPGGSFVGVYWHKKRENLTLLEGKATVDFGGGDSFSYDYELLYNPELNLYVGAYTIKSGTGALDQATGGGEMIAEPAVNDEGMAWLDGDLFLE